MTFRKLFVSGLVPGFAAFALLLVPVEFGSTATPYDGTRFIRMQTACAQDPLFCEESQWDVCYVPSQPERPIEGWRNII